MKILYVEDEPFLAKIVKESLESNNFQVDLLMDGESAIRAFDASSTYDICILDIMLPRSNGYEIARHIRSLNGDVPIIFLTAKSQTDDLVKGFDAGGNDYVRKPFSVEELIVRIHNLVELTQKRQERKSDDEGFYLTDDVLFDSSKLILKVFDEMISVSFRESQILKLLCDSKDGITQRKSLLREVWGDDSFYNSRNLDVYITRIRGYLKPAKAIKIITLKGVGYKLSISK